MHWLRGWARHRVVSLWVALCLIGIAVAMALFALSDDQMVAFVRGLALPGQPVPDTSRFDGGAMARAEAIIAAALGAAVIAFPSRALFLISGMWSLLAFATGTSWQVGYPRLLPIHVGPIVLATSSVAIALTLMAAAAVAGCLVGWFALPSQYEHEFSFMPPPTHQG